MMLWVNAIAILVSTYVFAYGLMRTAAIVLPRILPQPVSPLPLGMATTISVVGFCMVTGTPGPVVLAMIIVAITATRSALTHADPFLHRLALVLAGLLVGSQFLTQESWAIPSVSNYVPAAIAAGALVFALFVLEQAAALRQTLLVAISIGLLAAPLLLPAPYHVALDGALVLLGIAAFYHAQRHIRRPVMLDGAFTLPASIIVLHGVLVTLVTSVKGL